MGVSKVKRYFLWLCLGLSLAIFSCQQRTAVPRVPIPVVNAALIDQPLVPLSQPGPWAEVSHLISYDNRLWFANSMLFNNHNSADIYSYGPGANDTRLEQHLFSQSAGEPVVSEGLLYWPFEDPRFSADLGEYMVTNGDQWQWHILPEGEAFHVHAMENHGNYLWAATGAWSGGLQRSSDGGKMWELVYTYPTPDRRVSRVTNLVSLDDDHLLAEIMAVHEQGSKVLMWQGDDFQAIDSWPDGKRVKSLTAFQGHGYGVNQNRDDSYSVWRTDGTLTEPVTALDGHYIRAFAATETTLWAVSSTQSDGYLWRSDDGMVWTAVQQFTDMRPLDVAIHTGQVYVGGQGNNGKGVLWGPPTPQVLSTNQQSKLTLTGPLPADPLPADPLPKDPLPKDPLPQQVIASGDTQALEAILTSPITYTDGNAQDVLATALLPSATDADPAVGQQLTSYLTQALPVKSAQLFENNASAPATHVSQWYLLWAMGLNGHGQVPIELLQQSWTEPANDREKYWHPAPAAAWTAARLGQDDEATITAIIERLTTQEDPLWLVGDFVGALHALTGEQYGYDVSAWQQWWEEQKE
ncbi:beta propeller repeat protein [Leptothoe spongobia]|uniref:Photosynthesis system II assembly factor Ycf48/Hcf136-like domain-containing protein n=1 Tax=Leptothoe spongobia TAU-MAC 1115 TaxID=1967444 RepID=A0A947GID6_9CYAN|nr:hypothetical protein [Leptothoe spongobia]MBT9316090.1 hypothetical protein [Leptothoe spongobia TAU-MAC 1115]